MVSWKEFTDKIRLLIFQYEICTSLAVMDFKEKCIVHTILIGIMSTIMYSCYVYLPRCAWRFLIVCGFLAPPANDNILHPGTGNHFLIDS